MEIEEQEGYYRKPGNGLVAELLFFGAMTPENLKFMEICMVEDMNQM